MDDFKDFRSSPALGRKSSGKELERAAALLICTSLLQHDKPEERGDESGVAAALAPVLPGFWLTLAQATAALAGNPRSEAKSREAALEQTLRWLGKAVRQAPFDSHVLHTAGTVEYGLFDLEVIEEDEKQEILEQACRDLREAARIAPGRADILNDLGTVLGTKAEAFGGPEKLALLGEAVRCFDEAARCFNATTRRFSATGLLHPLYSRVLTSAGALRWALAEQSDDEVERRRLLRRGYRQLRLAEHDNEPLVRSMLGRAALDLAWLSGNGEDRRKLFDEACGHLGAVAETESGQIGEVYPFWGSAIVGCAALSSGAEREELIERAEELFAEATRHAPSMTEPDLTAANAWLLLAAESSGEQEQDAARRAAEAARRANRIEPGSGDHDLDRALRRLR
jgi:tetratricopeptide (TPR) repeat protein